MGKSHKYGLRTVAVFEALKGAGAVALCFIVLSLLHKDLYAIADHLTELLRIQPDSRIADWFYNLADHTTGRHIWMAASIGFVYSTGRFIEAYGLWHERCWAEWFAVLAGAAYLPWEIYALIHRPNLLHIALLVGNVIVVLYVLGILMETRRERAREKQNAAAKEKRLADSGQTASPNSESTQQHSTPGSLQH